jgi:CHASE3 domain sensor protein
MRRILLASGVLVFLMGVVFSILILAIGSLRETSLLSQQSQEVLAVANTLERLVLDVETGQRGFVITREPRFLEPWDAARRRIPEVGRELLSLTEVPGPASQSAAPRPEHQLVPSRLFRAADECGRADRDVATSVGAADEGKRRLDGIRAQFSSLMVAEQDLSRARRTRSTSAARRATILAGAGLGGSVILIALMSAYLFRGIVGPLRRTAAIGEVGALERSFNRIAASLEANSAIEPMLSDQSEARAALSRLASDSSR